MMKPEENGHDIQFRSLSEQIEGEVLTDRLSRYMLSTDASIYRKMPAAVVYPKTVRDVQKTVTFAATKDLSIHARGAGSGLCGAALGDGIVLDFSRHMNRLLEIDTQKDWFECEPGYRVGQLENALASTGLFFPPDPSSGEYATLGGMCATNASGAHSVKYGNTADYLLDAQLVTADGQVLQLGTIAQTPLDQLPENLRQMVGLYDSHRDTIENAYPPIPCNVAGYNLRSLVVNQRLRLHRLIAGSEGTLGIVTRLRFRLLPKLAADTLVVAYFDDIVKAARAVQAVLAYGPSGIEVMDKSLLELARNAEPSLRKRIPGDVDNVLLIEFDGASTEDCEASARRVEKLLLAGQMASKAYLAVDEEEKKKFWAVRKAAVPILYRLRGPKKILALVEDATVPIDRLVDFFKGLYAIFNRHQVRFVLYGHIAKGLLHTRPLLDLKDPDDIKLLRILADAVFELVVSLNGTVSGEHGDGRIRTAYIQKRYPQLYALFLQTKQLLDPHNRFNPEIKVRNDPDQMSQDLRFGLSFRSSPPKSLYLNWTNSFCEEVERCHGCSKCTTLTNATRMCPVYKFTRDERATPRAKANALRAVISGAVDQEAMVAETLFQVMSFCVNCGSCYEECPSRVNIPKLVMEAKAGQVRAGKSSITDRLTSRVGTAVKWTHRLAPAVTPLLKKPIIKKISQQITGLSAQRDLLPLAGKSLFTRFPQYIPGPKAAQVLYYAGCYAGYMRPAVGVAAVRVLNQLGFGVHLPPLPCCGLPALSKGFMGTARKQIKQNATRIKDFISRIDAIVVTCSSCGYALMNDWQYLLGATQAKLIADMTIHISQFLLTHLKDHHLSRATSLKIAYHQPCHLRIQKDKQSSMDLMAAVEGVTLLDLNSHCCGMAGSWGLAACNQRLSKTIGSQMIGRLNTSGAKWAVTDCPTCEMQMAHLGRLPVCHPIEIIRDRMQ